jgi:hypothetical protein
MRRHAVVVVTPRLDLAPGVEQIAEPTYVQTLFAQAAVEAFHVGVLDRLAGPDAHELNLLFQPPDQKRAAGKLRAIVADVLQTTLAGSARLE